MNTNIHSVVSGFLFAAAYIFFVPICCHAQQWQLSGNNIYNLNTGNVGIGVDNPGYKLVVGGQIHVDHAYPYLQLNSSYWGGGSFIQNGVNQAGGVGGDYLLFYNPALKPINFRQGTLDALTISSSGRVGINDLTPTYQLEVASNTGAALRLTTNSSTPGQPAIDLYDNVHGTELIINPSAGKVDMFTWGSHPLTFGTAASEKMRILPDGRLGINTVSPEGKLHIHTNSWMSSLLTLSDGSYSLAYNFQIESDGLKIKKGNTIQYLFKTSGDFIIYDGALRSKEVNVSLTPGSGPDYVFEPTYNLLPLSEVESYIKANKHLPEVPSAKQMEEEGLNLKEMNLLLLKKVEELTLHLIEQEKRVRIVENENLNLKSLITKQK